VCGVGQLNLNFGVSDTRDTHTLCAAVCDNWNNVLGMIFDWQHNSPKILRDT